VARPRTKASARKTASTKTSTSLKRATRTSASKRKSATKRTTSAGSTRGTFVCPECGKSFSRAASLGAHRNRAHGVAGAAARRNGASRPRTSTPARSARDGRVNRDALLASLFPNGVPAKEQIIRDLHAWLDEAERLARNR